MIYIYQVPWSRIGQEPVLVYLDRIYLLAEPETQVEGYSEDAVQKTKKSRIHVRRWTTVLRCPLMIFPITIYFEIGHGNEDAGE